LSFTVEHQFRETVVTLLDQSGQLEDVEVLLDSEGVFVRQWNEDLDRYEVVEFTNNQFKELLTALGLPEGMYVV
jgi:hypothetical protein